LDSLPRLADAKKPYQLFAMATINVAYEKLPAVVDQEVTIEKGGPPRATALCFLSYLPAPPAVYNNYVIILASNSPAWFSAP
jgi:hypothetical protein